MIACSTLSKVVGMSLVVRDLVMPCNFKLRRGLGRFSEESISVLTLVADPFRDFLLDFGVRLEEQFTEMPKPRVIFG